MYKVITHKNIRLRFGTAIVIDDLDTGLCC
jgi:hypothetical protein